MTLTPEHIAAIVGGFGVLIAAIAYYIRSSADARRKDADTKNVEAQTRKLEAEAAAAREKMEVDTDAKMFGTITDTITEARNEKAQLKADLRVAVEERDSYRINWQNAQTMLEQRNEQKTHLENEVRRLNIMLENTQRRLEYCLDSGDIDLTDFDDLENTKDMNNGNNT